MIQQLFRRIIILAFMICFLLMGSKIISYYQSGADRKSVFQSLPAVNSEATKKMVWRDNDIILQHPNIKYAISKDLHNAWHWLNKSIQSLAPVYLEDYFHEDVIAKLTNQFDVNSVALNREILSHDLELLHLSLDKSIAVIKDHECVVVQRQIEDNKEINFSLDTISYTAICAYSDGLWKINNWITETNQENLVAAPESELLEKNLTLVKSIKGINYYPQEYPWHYFWDSTTVDILKTDFAIVQDLGLNTIRIFIPYQSFSTPGKESHYINKLIQLLDVAQEFNLYVAPTLFDFPVGFELDRYRAYSEHLELLVPAVKEHPALIAWSIKNEPDLDFEQTDRQKVLDWLSFCVDRLKELDQNHPVTISWSKMKYIPFLEDKLDFLSFHLYLVDANWTNTLQTHKVHLNKPIVLEEFGVSTRSGFRNILGSSETHQMQYITDVISTAQDNQIPWMVWTLYDFKQIPEGVFKARPWIMSKQSHFGFIRKDGTKKEIYSQLKLVATQ